MRLKKERRQSVMTRLLISLFIGLFLAGCTSIEIRTEGQTQSLRWQATDIRNYTIALEKREIYEYTLVLQNMRGAPVTFTDLQGQLRNNPTSRLFTMEEVGNWKLPANGELRIPLSTYRYCHVVNCDDWGDLSPIGHLELIGTDAQGQAVREVIQLRLPYVADGRR